MPKRKVKQPLSRTSQYIQILMNLNILHSPCVSEKCEISYKHCSGCNESFPCKTAQVLAGRTVSQINRQIDEMLANDATVTIMGEQAEQVDES